MLCKVTVILVNIRMVWIQRCLRRERETRICHCRNRCVCSQTRVQRCFWQIRMRYISVIRKPEVASASCAYEQRQPTIFPRHHNVAQTVLHPIAHLNTSESPEMSSGLLVQHFQHLLCPPISWWVLWSTKFQGQSIADTR